MHVALSLFCRLLLYRTRPRHDKIKGIPIPPAAGVSGDSTGEWENGRKSDGYALPSDRDDVYGSSTHKILHYYNIGICGIVLLCTFKRCEKRNCVPRHALCKTIGI